jgi:hypothetical protein
MTVIRRAGVALLIAGASLIGSRRADAQRTRCDRIGTTAISFGRTGGNIKPSGVRILPTGAVRDLGDTADPPRAMRRVPVAVIRRLARRAWTGPFVRLPTAPTRPTPNPDAARDFIELHSACGNKHVEVQGGTGTPEFRRLLAELDSLTSVR